MKHYSFSFLILLVSLFSPSILAHNSNRYSWTFWGYKDGYRRCENICIMAFILAAALFVALCACAIYSYFKGKHKKKSNKEREDTYCEETDGNSMDEICVRIN
ncbi:hypothetical protein Glove_139g330 [Diversispora epigaea]|uniref:Uncharacterized protein n=1 Tax=Diversispora epigaea TaxID=1348612 RepID=A0A397IZZ0_9GLOM|nr:hypothetical protein Glove_139g330 [Diversispora epigaea]